MRNKNIGRPARVFTSRMWSSNGQVNGTLTKSPPNRDEHREPLKIPTKKRKSIDLVHSVHAEGDRVCHRTAIWIKLKLDNYISQLFTKKKRGLQLSFAFDGAFQTLVDDHTKANTTQLLIETLRLMREEKASIELLYQAWIELFHDNQHLIYRYQSIMKSPLSLMISSLLASTKRSNEFHAFEAFRPELI